MTNMEQTFISWVMPLAMGAFIFMAIKLGGGFEKSYNEYSDPEGIEK